MLLGEWILFGTELTYNFSMNFQFIVTIRRQSDSVCIYQKVLSCASADASILSCWDFSFPSHNLHYRGLYPRSWTLYDIPEHNVKLMCRQISPVLPNDYKVWMDFFKCFFWLKNVGDLVCPSVRPCTYPQLSNQFLLYPGLFLPYLAP